MRRLIAIALFAVGCASGPPAELVSARQAYERARTSSAAQYAPDELARSRQLLAKAERNYVDHAGAPDVRDYAYAATRQAERAEVLGRAEIAKQDKASAEHDLLAAQADTQRVADEKVARSDEKVLSESERADAERKARIDAEAQAGSASEEAAAAEARADSEEAARAQAEHRLAEATNARMLDQQARAAMNALTGWSAVSEEARGTVVRFGSEAMFAPDSGTLLPEASPRLDAVAETIKAHPRHLVIVECPADPTGSPGYREWLAHKRADEVRDQLVQRGVPAEQIRAGAAIDAPNLTFIIQR